MLSGLGPALRTENGGLDLGLNTQGLGLGRLGLSTKALVLSGKAKAS